MTTRADENPTRRKFLSAAAAAVLAPAACAGPRTAAPVPSGGAVPAARLAGLQAPDVEVLLAQMTLDEKIGQMTQADKTALADDRDVTQYFLGSVLSGGNSLPTLNDPATWVQMTNGFQSADRTFKRPFGR